MTVSQSRTPVAPFGRNVPAAAQYYLGNRWALFLLGGVAAGIGMYFGGWGWLVAVGAAPIILSVLPCLIMCGLGACIMCRSGKKDATLPTGIEDTAASASAVGTADIGALPAGDASRYHDGARSHPANGTAAQ